MLMEKVKVVMKKVADKGEVEYENDAKGGEINIDRETLSLLLRHVSWLDTKLFSQLTFLSNMAYVIIDMKKGDLRRYYGLEFVTSSMEKKAGATTIRDKVE
ncbi:UNVERIFIED_CONTAM: Phospholipase A1 PLIP1, chloroplastic [Sesamum radiatum]|uniref:Phospholipase A1 PLIP1, chloroplastic n=1 Tax=Sesamum radiatum TaxID=300843 RepID=A0AAW2V6R1_SESRA